METKAKLTPAEIRRKVWEHQEREKCRAKCRAKYKFNDEKSAQSQCDHYNTRGIHRGDKKKLYPYKCKWCAFWHTSANEP